MSFLDSRAAAAAAIYMYLMSFLVWNLEGSEQEDCRNIGVEFDKLRQKFARRKKERDGKVDTVWLKGKKMIKLEKLTY